MIPSPDKFFHGIFTRQDTERRSEENDKKHGKPADIDGNIVSVIVHLQNILLFHNFIKVLITYESDIAEYSSSYIANSSSDRSDYNNPLHVLQVFLSQLLVNHRNICLVHEGENDQGKGPENSEHGNVEIFECYFESFSDMRLHISSKAHTHYRQDNVNGD